MKKEQTKGEEVQVEEQEPIETAEAAVKVEAGDAAAAAFSHSPVETGSAVKAKAEDNEGSDVEME